MKKSAVVNTCRNKLQETSLMMHFNASVGCILEEIDIHMKCKTIFNQIKGFGYHKNDCASSV